MSKYITLHISGSDHPVVSLIEAGSQQEAIDKRNADLATATVVAVSQAVNPGQASFLLEVEKVDVPKYRITGERYR